MEFGHYSRIRHSGKDSKEERNGRYILLTARSGQPKFASNNRMEGTPEEYKAVVQGMIVHFG